MIRARVIPKSWLKTYANWMGYSTGSRSNNYLWENAYQPEVERTWAKGREVRLWRLTSSPEGQGGHQVDLFIDKETLLQEALLAYGGSPELLRALADRAEDLKADYQKAREQNGRSKQRIEELEAQVAEYVKRRAAGI